MKVMNRLIESPSLERLLEPVSQSLNLEAAEKLVRLRVNAKTQAHIDKLARKCTAGRLTQAERAEYEGWVAAIDLIAILQAKARTLLAETAKS
jgi:hypothetical protein